MNNSILVTICCPVFNHEKFIEKTIEGFLMQKTKFDFEILISNDASTDNSLNILNEYAIKNDHVHIYNNIKNQYSRGKKPLFHQLLPNAKGKYIALCEGDDYWTDPFKLQKQVDFLENNATFSASFTNALIKEENNSINKIFRKNTYQTNFSFKDILRRGGGFFPTATLVFRNTIKDFPEFVFNYQSGDRILALLLANEGKFYFLNEITAVYRKHPGGVFTSISKNKEKRLKNDLENVKLLKEINKYFNLKYNKEINEIISNYCMRILSKYPANLLHDVKNELKSNLQFRDKLRLIKNKFL